MRKDIFIDNTIAKNFSNPVDAEYKRLIAWLYAYNPLFGEDNAYLMVSRKLIAEYSRTSMAAASDTSIIVLLDKLTREGRSIMISNQNIKSFRNTYYTKRLLRRLRCNAEDRNHIPVVLLSRRQYALPGHSPFFWVRNNQLF